MILVRAIATVILITNLPHTTPQIYGSSIIDHTDEASFFHSAHYAPLFWGKQAL